MDWHIIGIILLLVFLFLLALGVPVAIVMTARPRSHTLPFAPFCN